MVRQEIKKILNLLGSEITRPDNDKFGDYSTSAALKLAKKENKNPMELAGELAKGLKSEVFEKVEIAKPGFINLFLAKEYLQKQVREIIEKGEDFGRVDIGQGKKVQIEFISANPTGPLTLGNGRGGFFGDVLANVMARAGFDAKREYFINDAGYQIEVLGHSYRKDDKAQYKGDYLEDPLLQTETAGLGILDTGTAVASHIMDTLIKPTIEQRMKIRFDDWVSEKEIRESGSMDEVLGILKEKNLTYEQEGATWFKSTQFGDDKDRVLITSVKEDREQGATYILPDAAYHYKKFVKDKFDKVIDVWGADHHGYIARLQAMGKALGAWDEKKLEIIIMQLVRLIKNGQEVKMSKRAGTYVTLDELLEEIPLDVARFFFLMHSPNTHMDFDFDLAREQSEKNPVYYVQYAFARIFSILTKAGAIKASPQNLELLKEPAETGLIKQLIRLPEIIEDTALDYQVQRLPQYALDLVRSFHKFYEECRVISEEADLTRARLALVEATRIVLKNTLDLMGISAPEKM